MKLTEVPFTVIHFQTKTELVSSGYGYRPHHNAENDHRKRSHGFENAPQSGTIWKRCFLKTLFSSVDGENDAIWKRCRHQNRHHRAPDHSTLNIQNGGQTPPCGFSLDRRCSVDRRKRYENDKCGRKSFWKRISVDGAWGSCGDLNSRWIQTKNRSVCENALTGIWGSCRLLVKDTLVSEAFF